MKAKLKICGICQKETVMWKSRTRDHPAMCKECALKNAMPIGSFKMTTQFKPIPKVSSRQIERLNLYKIAKGEHFKDYPNCQYPGCTARDRQLHHVCGRVGDLLFDKRYFKTLCDEHHKFVENNPTIAKEMGLSADRLDK